MKNFKEIAEKCLAGELSGVFIFNTEAKLHSQYLKKSGSKNYFYLREFFIDKKGQVVTTGVEGREIIDFIPDNMKEQIKIDIPEGKVPVMEQTEKGVVITWKEKELTYKDIENKIILKNHEDCIIGYTPVIEDIKTLNCPHSDFYKKVEVLRKLTNIRNYFGKPDENEQGWTIEQGGTRKTLFESKYTVNNIVFAKKEHAEQAIKMLGEELKYLFAPW